MSRKAALIGELERHQPADDQELRHQQEFLALLSGDADVFARTTFRPGHVTASCFILDAAGRLLLHHHRRLSRWLQMGGHIEQEETPLQAALREGKEESGLPDLELAVTAFVDLDVHPIPAGKGEPDHHHFDIRYIVRTRQPHSVVIDHAESIGLRWFDLDEAERVMSSSESSRVIRKISGVLCTS